MSDQEQNGKTPPPSEAGKKEGSAEKVEKKPPEKPPWLLDPESPEWQEENDDPLVVALREDHPESVEESRSFAGDLTLRIRRQDIADLVATLKRKHGYRYLVDVTAAHYPDREGGELEVVYHLDNFETRKRLRLKVSTTDGTPVPSLCQVFANANWPEREVYDMFGIRFEDHPDMTRILLWEGFNGYPLRKDFPVEGIDTGSAIYPEYYLEHQGPIAGTGTGWKPPKPPAPEKGPAESDEPTES